MAALHQGYGMRMNLTDGIPIVVRQTTNGMLDMEFVLAYDGCTRFPQQFVVVKQRAGDGILDGQHAHDGGVALDMRENFLESSATKQLHMLALEVSVSRYVVK